MLQRRSSHKSQPNTGTTSNMNQLYQGMFSPEACRERMRHRNYIRFVILTTLACTLLIAVNSIESLTVERTRLFLSRADCTGYPPEVLQRAVKPEEDAPVSTAVGGDPDILKSDNITAGERHDRHRTKKFPQNDTQAREKIEKPDAGAKTDDEEEESTDDDASVEVEPPKDIETASDETLKEEKKSAGRDPEVTGAAVKDEPVTESDQPLPKIAWLMSFPNSGTSYTMTMVARASTRATATNYASEVTAKGGVSLQVDPESPRGPFWAGMNSTVRNPRPLPDKFVMTKTHCGSRCTDCGPDEYIQTAEEYLMLCASGHALLPERIWGTYDMKNVERGIHLLRNPFHNIIARFHLDRRQRAGSKRTDWSEWLKEHPNNAIGLQKWCREMDEADAPLDAKFFGDAPMNLTKVPCHREFYLYTQWHNLLFKSLELMPNKIPIHTVYYEDYSIDVDGTIKGILDFLELNRTEAVPEFRPKSYDGYFSPKQEEKVRDFIQWVAIDQTWEKVQHYFSDE